MNQRIINKILIPCAVVPLCTTTFISCGVRNSEDGPYEEMAKKLCEDVLEEFIKLSQIEMNKSFWLHHRSTFNTKPFIDDYLKPRIRDIYHSMGEQTPKFTDITYDPGKEHESDRLGYNFYFDIKATNPELPPIVVQCHTDMVWKYDTSDPDPETRDDSPGINVVRNWANNTYYTAPYLNDQGKKIFGRTTLGADNGIGIATILSLCAHKDEFNHGIIRCLFTTDEEDGPSGASAINESVFVVKDEKHPSNDQTIDYCLNIDLEDNHIMARSCGGTQTATWTLDYNRTSRQESGYELHPVNEYYSADACHVYKLDVTKLLGGHSGLDINKNRINGAKFAGEILSAINWNGQVRLVSFSTNGSEIDTDLSYSSIPTQAHVVFATNLNKTDAENILQTVINSAHRDHPTENKFECTLTELPQNKQENPYTVMGKFDTYQFIKFLAQTLTFGPISFLETGAVQTCANIGTTLFRPNSNTWSDTQGTAIIALQGRSSDINQLGKNNQGTDPLLWEGFMDSFYLKSVQDFGLIDETGGIKSDSWTPPWAPREDDKLQSVILDGAKELGQTIKPSDEPGWLEVAYFLQAHPGLYIACIGPQIDNAHSVNETLHTDTLVPMLRLLLYTLDNLPSMMTREGGYNG